MSSGATYRTLLEQAAQELGGDGRAFAPIDIVKLVRRRHPDRKESTIRTMIMGLVVNGAYRAEMGAPLFRRIDHGTLVLLQTATTPSSDQATERRTTSRSQLVQRRVSSLKADMPAALSAFAADTPFTRTGQWSQHRTTIDMRRGHATVRDALEDNAFCWSLYETLRRWGIGIRGSKLVPQRDFQAVLLQHARALTALENLTLDDSSLETAALTQEVWLLISNLGVVENRSKIVAGTKTLHHLLPDLVPPIDVTWTGAFFGWQQAYFLARQPQIFKEGFETFGELARACDPQQYVGPGWHTSRTKVLDNALIGYCKLEGLGPARGGAR